MADKEPIKMVPKELIATQFIPYEELPGEAEFFAKYGKGTMYEQVSIEIALKEKQNDKT